MRKLFPLCMVATSLLFFSAFKFFPSRAEMNTEAAAKAADQVMVTAFWPGPFTKDPVTQKKLGNQGVLGRYPDRAD